MLPCGSPTFTSCSFSCINFWAPSGSSEVSPGTGIPEGAVVPASEPPDGRPAADELPSGRPAAGRFFTGHEAAVVEAATARIVPGPEDDPAEAGHPGAREAGVTDYIDLMLGALSALDASGSGGAGGGGGQAAAAP